MSCGKKYAPFGLTASRWPFAPPKFFHHLPPRRRNPDPDDLDRLAASLDHLTLCCCEPGTDETDDRRPPEAVAAQEQFLRIAEKPRQLGRGKSGEVKSHVVLLGHSRRN
jgi:hypothetical protein